ncbi:type IV pilus biogenesis protein PilM [Chloroflexota bacterium]
MPGKKVVTLYSKIKMVSNLLGKKVVTLYIDDTNIRLLVAKGKRVKSCAEFPLEAGLVRDGFILDEVKLADKIKEFLKAQRIKTRKVIVGLSGLHYLSRVLTLPQLPIAMLDTAVKQEAERELPLPLEQLYLSWQIISATEEEIRVFLVACPHNVTDTLINTLRQAGVKPYLIDLAPFALARVADRATAIIVDVRPTEFDIVIMVNGVPHPIRTVSLLDEELSLQEKLPMIKEELERTTKFYDSTYPENPIGPGLPIFISGELFDEMELSQSLSDQLGSPVLELLSPLNHPEDLAVGKYMVNIGLALKKLSGEKANHSVVNLNVLPDIYRPKAPSLTKVLVPTGTIVAIGVLAQLVMQVQDITIATASMQAQLNSTNQRLQLKQAQQQLQENEIAELEKIVAGLEETSNALTGVFNNFSSQQEIVNGDLKVTMSALSGTVGLVSITHSGVGLVISGVSPGETGVLEYADALRASGRFSQVVISAMGKDENEMKFTLILQDRGQE